MAQKKPCPAPKCTAVWEAVWMFVEQEPGIFCFKCPNCGYEEVIFTWKKREGRIKIERNLSWWENWLGKIPFPLWNWI
ncbi:MAG: hypothetical protein US30_C0003G0047 [Candidatus Moranbacteria bacterium GW2011_GWF2_36_839]|nr:MAG: hypothetical protein US27_C0004G0047 [Candidatus Moranbacteria bacterium GW2011_GWF1_36_78]KKQ17480.1 MAG: hypothetical protein US30_C0003G0047 [Candidatus Moranbacteria bacterium GW2011_GWF2_36_839]HAT73947.1 hypothetical protein [Candidatus Moranbacteria bacterium]HBY10527.1 hypothetical protein [Candidatus Moranbacteria bacterium]